MPAAVVLQHQASDINVGCFVQDTVAYCGRTALSAASADDGREVSLDDLDYVEGAVGTENNGIRMIETDSRTMDLDDLDYVEGTVRTESNGLRMTENILWRVEDLANLEYVEGDVGAEAHGIKIIEAPEH